MGKREPRTASIANWMVVLLLAAAAPGKIIFVDDDALGPGDGASWTSAFAHL